MFDSAPQGEPGPPQQAPEPRSITAEDVFRNQRANLALRALDLEVELVLLQEDHKRLIAENSALKTRVEELETAAARTAR